MDRRDFLTITGGAPTGLAGQWGGALTSPPLPKDSRGRLTPEVLSRLDNRLAELRRLDGALGSRDLCHLAAAEFRYLTHLADDAVYDHTAGQRLFSLMTGVARLCGWLHFDAVHSAAAQSYYIAALRSSALANDALAGAHVLSCMCYQATLAGYHSEAVSLMEAAEERTRHVATPRLKALLASNKAHAHAKAGYAKACGFALNDAERWLDKASREPKNRTGSISTTKPTFGATPLPAGSTSKQSKKARPHIDNALSARNSGYVGDRAVYHVRSA